MKILIIKTSSLGDIIHAFPVVAAAKKKHPQAQIDWVVESAFAELIEAHPQVNRVIKIDTKKWRKNPLKKSTWQEIEEAIGQIRSEVYDVILDLQGNIKSGIFTALANGPLESGLWHENCF